MAMIGIKRYMTGEGHAAPMRVLRYKTLYCTEGNARVLVDEKLYQLSEQELLTITSGQYHQVQAVAGELLALDFTLDYFCKNDHDIELIFHNGLFCHFGMTEVITMGNVAYVNQLFSQLERELEERPYQYLLSAHALVELLLVEINRHKIASGAEIWKPDALFLRFLEAVRDNYPNSLTVADFALLLGTSESKLNELARLHTDKTAQHVIYSLTISEAKRLLHYEKLTIKDIAYRLGFNDPFYFSNFFKKHTALSPKAYKKMMLA